MTYKTLAMVGLSALSMAGTAQAQVISMAVGAQGALACNSGQAVAIVANENGLTVRTQPLVGYMPLLNSGEVSFGLANGAEAAIAFGGKLWRSEARLFQRDLLLSDASP